MNEFRNIGIYDAWNDPIHVGYACIDDAVDDIKHSFTEDEWNESGYSLCTVIEDDKGCVLMFDDNINPFTW